jgi:putative oxidoreductase
MIGSRHRALSAVAVVLGVAMIGSGLSKLAGESHQVTSFALWGLPPWFRALVGTFEIVGALLLIVRATRPIGSLVLSTIMVGAVWLHLAHGELAHLVPAGVLLTLFLTIFWNTRSSAVRLLGGVAPQVPALRAAQARHVVRDVSPADADGVRANGGKIVMSGASRAVVWFERFVLAAAALVMMAIAIRTLRDPVAATLPMGIVLGSPTAVTIARVGLGGFPLGFALILFGCLTATDRLLTGLTFLVAVVTGAIGARIEGLILDGATAYNLVLLRPEFVILTLALIGIVLERRRRHAASLRALESPAGQHSASRAAGHAF